jgi:hypothetical protein
MTHIMLLIAALNSLDVHGNREKCIHLADSLADLAVVEATNPLEKPVHIDEDLKAIREFLYKCEEKK